MTDWYYSTGGTEQAGPVSEQQLIGLFQSGQIAPETLVWREGQANWLPLRRFFDELRLQESAPRQVEAPPAEPVPPPPELPPEPAPPPQYTSEHASVLGRQAATAPAKPSGMSGCAIAAIVLAVVGLLLLGVLAAIAIPAYQDYVRRSDVVAAWASGKAARTAIPEYLEDKGQCPENGSEGFKSAADYADARVEAIRFGSFENDRCGLEVELKGNGLDGHKLWMVYDAEGDRWTCSSDLRDRWLPADCKGG
ncbi:GYF domain-containing protein [Thermomonas sp.]|uniref:GYF domain-containing protein n=1 Tax=Thermomonas sp. TaxID=1971895 RepID=UPI00260C48F0|nr:GYF domain-containing protein [Thermomonas sp.]